MGVWIIEEGGGIGSCILRLDKAHRDAKQKEKSGNFKVLELEEFDCFISY